MAETTYTNYPIKWLNDTYYQISRTSSFWSGKVKIDHSFYVNGYHHCIGSYSQSEYHYWTNFVEFLNMTSFYTSSYYTEAFKRPTVQWFLRLIERYTFKDISTSIMYFSFRDCLPGAYKQIEGVSKVEDVTIMPNNRDHCDVLAPLSARYYSVKDAIVYVNGSKYREISGEDFRAIIAIVHLSFLCYLPKMKFDGFFTFHNDPTIIEQGKQNKWLY
jgi:hypothetical protein